jgi:hypothetical protein
MAAHAQGASISLSDSNCDSFALSGTAPNQVLTCVVSNVPNCTVTAPASATINTNITLTAACSGSPTRWVWSASAGNCTTQTCSVSSGQTGAIAYSVTATNNVGQGPTSPAATVTWSNQVAAAPSGCAITASPSATLAQAGVVTLTMSCSGGGAPTGYSWSGGFAQGANTAQVSGTVSSSTAFSATASNAGGSASATQTVSVGGGPGPGGSCTGFTNTRILDIDWNNPQVVLTGTSGGVGPNDAIVVRFTTGAGANPGFFGNITGAEYTSDPSTRAASLSATMCDFNSTLGFGASSTSNTVTVNFSVGSNSSGYYPALQPNTTYYYNVKQLPGSTCASSGNCNMYFQLHKPPGL